MILFRNKDRKYDKKLAYFAGLIERQKFAKARNIADLLINEGCPSSLICFTSYPFMERFKINDLSKARSLARHFYSHPYCFECWLSKKERDKCEKEKARYINPENLSF